VPFRDPFEVVFEVHSQGSRKTPGLGGAPPGGNERRCKMNATERDGLDVSAYSGFKARILSGFTPKDAGEAAAADALAGGAWRLEAALAGLLGERSDGRPFVKEARFIPARDLV